MSNQIPQDGSFITQLNGRRCTAVPRTNAAPPAATSAVAGNNGNVNGGGAGVGIQSSPTPAVDSSTSVQVQTENEEGAASTTRSPPQLNTPPSEDTIDTPTSTQEQEPVQETQTQPPPPPPLIIAPPSPSTLSFPASLPSPTKVAEGAQSQSPPTPNPPLASSTTDESTAVPDASGQIDVANNQPQQQPDQQAPAPTPTLVTPDNTTPDVVNGNLATTAAGGINGAAAVGEGASDPTTTAVSDGGNRSGAPTAVVAGSVAGGVAVVSIIAFLLWFWRKKAINKRRSSLLTPLTIEPSTLNGNNTEKAYIIERGSVGPTPKAERFKAAVGARLQGFKGRVGGSRSGPSVDLNGASQYDDASTHSRSNSSSLSLSSGDRAVVTGKDRFKDWWSRVTADVNFNWKMRNDRTMDADPAAAVRNVSERKGSQPDFLTLLGMDDKEVQREAQKRQANHSENGSAGSSSHFLGGLNLNFDSPSNPFSDMNALSHDSAKPAPLTVSPRANPFSDANAVSDGSKTAGTKPPTTYVADVRRSRGLGQGRQPSVVDSVCRESVASVDNMGPKRNKFRSDPFDLERPELLGSRQDLTTANMTAAESKGLRGSVNRPKRAHTRDDSFSSKYSSGFSLGDWSDPGPDVGPGSTRWDSPTPEGFRPGSRQRGGSDGSVGKAL
ncbi:hypothetical protein jhhlp_005699 [Lomentospora prolificans]|uniref:Uncharacterized protein n=1 Tax=Lomentospora prolificans TaxID=41688 RepID=A0A2N3N3T7_9PEZI|nr:hypothetical protein jhhlp_005699 [Lomentospora prolificans]